MDIIDFKKEFEARVRSTSSFSEILDAYKAVARIPVETEMDTLSFFATRNFSRFETFEGDPLFGSFTNYSKKSFCVQLERTYDVPNSETGLVDFCVTICYPAELWNLGLLESHMEDVSYDDFIAYIEKSKTYRHLMTHDCRPDFVHVYLDITK